jgi:hypothetical protein
MWKVRAPVRRPLLLAVSAALLAASGCTGSSGRPTPAAGGSGAPVRVVVQADGSPLGTIAPDFEGLSYETGGLPSGAFDAAGDLPQLLRNLGPGVLRFGGNSADKQYVAVGAEQLAALAGLARASGWKVIYSENEGEFNAAQVTKDSAAVANALGPALLGLACGNEPDHWNADGHRPQSWSAKDEPADAAACLAAVRAGAPKAPFVGNDAGYNEGTGFITDYFPWAKGKAALLTRHFYPLTNCADKARGSAQDLVSAKTAATEDQRLKAVADEAAKVSLPLRMSETNSASCSGIPGVSDSDASALWAADYLLRLAENGIVGANFHGSLTDDKCTGYTPLCRTGDHEYRAQPVYYGMLFAHLMGTGHALPVQAASSDQLAAHAVEAADGTIRTMLLNRGSSPLTVTVDPGPHQGATISGWRLAMPSLTATGGVTIAGSQIAADGSFNPGAGEQLSCSRGSCVVTLPADSGIVLGGAAAS